MYQKCLLIQWDTRLSTGKGSSPGAGETSNMMTETWTWGKARRPGKLDSVTVQLALPGKGWERSVPQVLSAGSWVPMNRAKAHTSREHVTLMNQNRSVYWSPPVKLGDAM